jgi:hypothetical protein
VKSLGDGPQDEFRETSRASEQQASGPLVEARAPAQQAHAQLEDARASAEQASAPLEGAKVAAQQGSTQEGCRPNVSKGAAGPQIAPSEPHVSAMQAPPCSDGILEAPSQAPASLGEPILEAPTNQAIDTVKADPDFFPLGLPGRSAPLPKPTATPESPLYEGPPAETIGKPKPDLITSENVLWGGALGSPQDVATPTNGGLARNSGCVPSDPVSETVSFPKYVASSSLATCNDTGILEAPVLPVPNIDTILQDTRWDVVGPMDLPVYESFNNLLRSFR